MDNEKTDITEETGQAQDTAQDKDEGRPPRDPKNGLYTVLSILIFAVCYIGVKLVGANVALVYAVHETAPSAKLAAAAVEQFDAKELSESGSLDYVRIHRNFDNDRLYLSFTLYCDTEEAAELVPFEYGDVTEEERFSVLSDGDMHEHPVIGDLYVNNRSPSMSCIIYEDEGNVHALLSTADYDKDIRFMFEGEKIKVQ